MHIADPDIGMLGANGIVGAGIPIATGVALSAQIRGTDHYGIPWIISSALAKKDLNFSLMPLEEAVLLHINDARTELDLSLMKRR